MNYEKALEAAEYIKSKYGKPVRTALVLGSGLGGFAEKIENRVVIPYEEIPGFLRSTVEGHAGRLVLGEVNGVSIAVQQGRFHYYEGYDIQQVVFPVRTFKLLGVENLVLTNAAGSVRTSMRTGSLMLLRDHINLMGVNPLRGANEDRFGPRFPDMTQAYDFEFQHIASEEAQKLARERFEQGKEKEVKQILRRGVYIGLAGPNYETPVEIRMLRLLGGDAVGMSTVPEAITARHMGMRVLGISCITNAAAGLSDGIINHEEVMEIGTRIGDVFEELLRRIVPRLA